MTWVDKIKQFRCDNCKKIIIGKVKYFYKEEYLGGVDDEFCSRKCCYEKWMKIAKKNFGVLTDNLKNSIELMKKDKMEEKE